MKFLFIVPRYHINIHYMVKALKEHQQDVDVFSLYQGKSENHSVVKPVILGYAYFFKLLRKILGFSEDRIMKSNFEMRYAHPSFFKLFFLIKERNPEVVIIKNIQSILSIQSLLIAKFLSKKIVILMQLPKYRAKSKSFSVALVARLFGAKVLTPVLGDRKYKNNNDNLYYLPFVIDVKDFTKQYKKNGNINIICVGKIQERKGQIFLLQAINQLFKQGFTNLRVDFYGEEDESEYLQVLQQYIVANKLQTIVTLNRDLPHQELMSKYEDYDLFVLPSWSESAAFSILEAMSKKLAVICTDDNGTKTYVQTGVNGYIVPARNSLVLQEKILSIIKNDNNLQTFGSASFAQVEKEHNLGIFYQSLLTILE